MKTIQYGIIGANGFTGKEILHLANQDKRLECVFKSSSQENIEELSLKHNPKIVFFATPHGVCMQYAPFFLSKGIKVIDLSGDFRFKNIQEFEKAYSLKHLLPTQKAIFGLPETYNESGNLVANPGCYVTTSLLPLLPLSEYCERIIIDGKSGFSGAGKNFSKQKELEENICIPYTLIQHRHEAEIQQFFSCPVSFTPHLINTFRGMLVTLHIFLKPEHKKIDAYEIIKKQYKNSPLVIVQKEIPTIQSVQNTNKCYIGGFEKDENGRLVIISTLDNLRKGASGQAMQNLYIIMNIEPPPSFYEKS